MRGLLKLLTNKEDTVFERNQNQFTPETEKNNSLTCLYRRHRFAFPGVLYLDKFYYDRVNNIC